MDGPDAAPLGGQPEFHGDPGQIVIAGPEPGGTGEGGRSKEVGVEVSDASADEFAALDQTQDLSIGGAGRRWEIGQQIEDGAPIPEMATGKLTEHHGVDEHFTCLEGGGQPGISPAQVIDPD
jgi:hypothetical protein